MGEFCVINPLYGRASAGRDCGESRFGEWENRKPTKEKIRNRTTGKCFGGKGTGGERDSGEEVQFNARNYFACGFVELPPQDFLLEAASQRGRQDDLQRPGGSYPCNYTKCQERYLSDEFAYNPTLKRVDRVATECLTD